MSDPAAPTPPPVPPDTRSAGPYRLAPGPVPATPNDLRVAQERDRLLRDELPRVRQAATAWRNGLGALLLALVGFGLVKGRSDVSLLTAGWAAAVGLLLFAAVVAGAVGAWLLLRAAHGRPAVTDVRRAPPSRAADHIEALASAAALRRGTAATLGCALLLVGAVGATWYGPARAKPALRVTTPSGSICGYAVRLGGSVVLKTDAGEVAVDLSSATTIAAVDGCR